MAETQLTHKLRNPKSYNEWMNIWTSHIQKDSDDNVIYEIYPSSNWKIPISQLTSDTIAEGGDGQTITENDYTPWPEDITVPVNQIADIDNIHNVTTTEGTQNHLAQFGTNGEIIDGPEINSVNGNENEFLNKKGNWTTISGEAGITVDGTTIKHSNTEIASGTAGTRSVTYGTTVLEIPYITYDNYGHITAAGTHLHNLEGFLTSGGTETINGSRITGNNSLSVSVINSNGLNDTIRSKLNTQTEAGVVVAGNGHNSEVWLTDNNQNPAWGKITVDHMAADLNLNDKLQDASVSGSKLDTRLLGVWINDMQPTNINVESYNQLDTTQMKKRYSQSFRVQKTGQTLEPYYVVSSNNSYFELAQQNDDFSKIILKQYFISSFNCRISDDGTYYDVSIYYNTATLKTFNITDILPDLTYLGDLYKSAFNDFYNSTIAETNSNYISSNDYFSIRLNAQNKIMNDYVNTLDSSSEHKTTAIDYTFGSNLLNNWDYEHCGIWIEI